MHVGGAWCGFLPPCDDCLEVAVGLLCVDNIYFFIFRPVAGEIVELVAWWFTNRIP